MKGVIALLSLATLAAAESPRTETVFACSLGAKQVSVRAVGTEIVYRFGTRDRAALTIVGSAAKRNLFYRTARYSGIENQLRFANGRYNYIVFSLGANAPVGARGVSGLTVMDGTKIVAEHSCRRWSDLDSRTFDFSTLPEDGEQYSAL